MWEFHLIPSQELPHDLRYSKQRRSATGNQNWAGSSVCWLPLLICYKYSHPDRVHKLRWREFMVLVAIAMNKTRDCCQVNFVETCPALEDCDNVSTQTVSQRPHLVLGHVWALAACIMACSLGPWSSDCELLLPFPLEHTFWQRWIDGFSGKSYVLFPIWLLMSWAR